MPSTRVLLIRHAEPEAGWGEARDPGLSPAGRTRAQAVAEALVRMGARRAVSSPMRRCLETAAPFVARTGLALVTEPRVTEVPSPEEGDRKAWLRGMFPAAFDAARTGNPWAQCGDAITAWRNAACAAIGALEQDTAVFTHFIAINAVVSAALGREDTIVLRPPHGAIVEMALTDGVLNVRWFSADESGAIA